MPQVLGRNRFLVLISVGTPPHGQALRVIARHDTRVAPLVREVPGSGGDVDAGR